MNKNIFQVKRGRKNEIKRTPPQKKKKNKEERSKL